MDEEAKKEEAKKDLKAELLTAYNGDEEEARYAASEIECLNKELEMRERNSIVFNGVAYSTAYLDNQQKAINYAPPRDPEGDRQISVGIVHEKIIGFCALFLKYIFKRYIKCYDKDGNIIPGLGTIYDLAIEHSYCLETFKKKIGLIYWELFSQGDVFVLEDFDVRTIPTTVVKNEAGDVVDSSNMDYTYENLEKLKFEDGPEPKQTRRAISRILDGRMIILGNPEINELQDQDVNTVEEKITRAQAEQIYGTLSRWAQVPKQATEIVNMANGLTLKLFGSDRLSDPSKEVIVHRRFHKTKNRMNIFINGVMMLPRNTPMSVFYPRLNYPITQFTSERITGSAYSRSVPAKTKFNADFIDWVLTKLADKFEQGVEPALFTQGKFTLTRKIFRGGQITHGIDSSNIKKVDPDNKGVTSSEFGFFEMLKSIIESQTLSPTTTGQGGSGDTATEVTLAQNQQVEKLAFLLDAIVAGWTDMALRRAETIESKYTTKVKETIVDGKTINVYTDFTVNMGGMEHVVTFDDEVGTEGYPAQEVQDKLFKKSFDKKKEGNPTQYYRANPRLLREEQSYIEIEVKAERVKDSQLQLMQMWDEFGKLKELFPNVNQEELQSEYLKTSGRSDKLFLPQEAMTLDKMMAAQEGSGYNTGSFGKPKIKQATKADAMMR